MQYTSTRANAQHINFEQAATCGLAPDGGLYVPVRWPSFDTKEIRALQGLPYADLALEILVRFADASIPRSQLKSIADSAWQGFDHPEIAPLREIKHGLHLLELFHGPTLSFKDYALQFLGQFMSWSLSQRNQQLTIVGATSGDTGSAAISAVAGCDFIDLYMLHPFQRVSDIQRRQMTTNQDTNIFNYAVDGTFDDCQAIIKTIFSDKEVQRYHSLAAVNSINWGRIASQVIYYFFAALKLGAPDIRVNFAVPTGNFGNVFAGWTAARMGLPIERIIVCSNANDILTRFFETGEMQKRGVIKTSTPSMDIEVSSNFERFLFELLDRDGNRVESLMKDLNRNGSFRVTDGELEKARSHFSGFRASDEETCDTIARHYRRNGDIIDPHTAVAMNAVDQLGDELTTPVVVVATAHPAKFSQTIEQTLEIPVPMPPQLTKIADLPERYRRISSNPEELKSLILAS